MVYFAFLQSLHRKGSIRLSRSSDRETSLVCRWEEAAEEGILDALRSMSEGCDYTDSIDLFFSFLSADNLHHPQKLLEMIRDDFGPSVSVPLFLFASSELQDSSINTQRSVFGEVARAAALQSVLAECSEHASVLVPLHVTRDPGLLAQALDTALSFRLPAPVDSADSAADAVSTNFGMRSSDWAARCTGNGQLPVVFLEGGHPSLVSEFASAIPPEEMFSSLSQLSGTPQKLWSSGMRNPFLASFAPHISSVMKRATGKNPRVHAAVADDDSDISDNDATSAIDDTMRYDHQLQRQYERPFSNFLSLRLGSSRHSNIAQDLFLQCLQSPYLLTGVSVACGLPTSIALPSARGNGNHFDDSKRGFDGMSEYRQRLKERETESDVDYAEDSRFGASHLAQQRNDIREPPHETGANAYFAEQTAGGERACEVVCGASLGATRDTGRYLATQRLHWRQSVQSSSSSLSLRLRLLNMLQYEGDDVERISDMLMSLSESYLSHA